MTANGKYAVLANPRRAYQQGIIACLHAIHQTLQAIAVELAHASERPR